ncbi:MAG: hypothetical protein Q7U47_01355 [Paludibacter sp.]|nr:hypothetical protein [Paludibacter sp.]
MSKFNIIISEHAKNNIDDYIDFIFYEYKSPLTSLRHKEGLIKTINELSKNANVYKYCSNKSVTDIYGIFSKRINYKQMAIIFSIYNDTVIIHAVLKQSVIKGL